MHYRNDIDGLRAIAVASVLLYHFQLAGLTGGFLGVDIFFVISGYLISSIILAQTDKNTFSFVTFYKRRILRIFPLLALVLLCSLSTGIFLLSLKEYRLFSQDAVYAALGISNIHFFLNTSYFDVAARSKPLLHTWSLGVEEQFYFFLPVALFAMRKRSVHYQVLCLAGAAFISLAAMLLGAQFYPDATFYLLPFRAWELLAGCLLAFMMSHSPASKHNVTLLQTVSVVGLILIVFSIVFADSQMHPGWITLLPVAGTCAVIWGANHERTIVHRFLALSPMRCIGKISYSLYLWHWPILVFGVLLTGPLSTQSALIMLTCSVLLSWVSWRFVEQPVRHSLWLQSGWNTARFATPLLLVIVVAGIAGFSTQGLPQRLTTHGKSIESLRHFHRTDIQPEKLSPSTMTKLGEPTSSPHFLVWGDSHAEHLYPVLSQLAESSNLSGLMGTLSSTLPSLNVQLNDSHEKRIHFSQKMFETIQQTGIKNIIIAVYWQRYTLTMQQPGRALLRDGTPIASNIYNEVLFASVTDVINKLKQLGCTVWLVEDIPAHAFSALDELQRPFLSGNVQERYKSIASVVDVEHQPVRDFLKQQEDSGTHIIRTRELFLDNGNYISVADNLPLYRDSNHLTAPGALILKPAFAPAFKHMRSLSQQANLRL